MITTSKVYVIIPAAGSGTRIGGRVKKQFLRLDGIPILMRTLMKFDTHATIDGIVVVAPSEQVSAVRRMIDRGDACKVIDVTAGGKHRQESVYNGLLRLACAAGDIVIVHDAVRPFIDDEISLAIEACRQYKAAVVAVPSKDTVRLSRDGKVFAETLDRDRVYAIQTPQVFRAGLLLKAFEQARKDRFFGTDEAGLVERLGVHARIVPGSYDNIKITTPEDLELAKMIFKRRGE